MALKAFGEMGKSLPLIFPGVLQIFDGVLPKQRLVVLIFAVLIMGGLWYFLVQTKQGRGLCATAQNRVAARLQGIRRNGLLRKLGVRQLWPSIREAETVF